MKFLIDSSVFLHLLLDEERADEAEDFLLRVESGDITAYVIPSVLEEVSFKLLMAKASELGETRFWDIRKRLLRDKNFRAKCFEPLKSFRDYVLSLRGLVWEPIGKDDWLKSLEIVEKYGLLTSDAIIAAVALRLKIPLFTFDTDFKRVSSLEVRP